MVRQKFDFSIKFLKELYDDQQGFVILEWSMEDGSRFIDAEYVRVVADHITEILVVNNDPAFTGMVST